MWNSPNFNAKKKEFQNLNPLPLQQMNSSRNFFKILKEVAFNNSLERYPKNKVSIVNPNLNEFLAQKDTCSFIWLGHSSVLLNHFGTSILFDPVFYNAAPVQFAVKRYSPAPVLPHEIPEVDLVILSHDHYDHFDAKALQQLKFSKSVVLAPLGLKKRLSDLNIRAREIREFDWWDSIQLQDLKLTFTPAQHFSGRGIFDRNSTLWGSWCIKSGRYSLFFSGDSGYNNHFKEIGSRLGPFDLAMMETGQYNKLWKAVHMLPEESVQASLDVKAKYMLPIHWGAYCLSTHAWYEPADRALNHAEKLSARLVIPKMGEIVDTSTLANGVFKNTPWWKS